MARPRYTVMEYRSYELPSDFPILVLSGSEWRISSVPSNRLHFHNCFEVGLCLSDSGTIRVNGENVPFEAGSVTCMARNTPHTTWSSPDVKSLWAFLYLDPEALIDRAFINKLQAPSVFNSMISDCGLVLTGAEYAWATDIVRDIIKEMSEKRADYRMYVQALCAAFFVRLLRVYAISAGQHASWRENTSIFPAINYIHTHYMQPFPLEELAAICDLSPVHFRRLFHAQMDMTPLAYLHNVRILKSCTLLRTSEENIADIASQVGYTSLSCYNRRFLELIGCTPSAWRKLPDDSARHSLVSYTGWQRAETGEEISERNRSDRRRQ
ncbi:MAG: helix-turn-helix transcriptional regulator [Clostridia bacterium]|nr:helix-turn-helix transcriptional regulator [Clostridia bacterium]